MHMRLGLQRQQYSPPVTLSCVWAQVFRDSNIHLQLFSRVMRSLYQAGKSFDIYLTFEDHLRHMSKHKQLHISSQTGISVPRCKPKRQSSGFQQQQQCYGQWAPWQGERRPHLFEVYQTAATARWQCQWEKCKEMIPDKNPAAFQGAVGSGLGLSWLDGINADKVVTDPAVICAMPHLYFFV